MSTFRPNWDKAQALDTLETVTKQMAVAVTRCSRDLRYLWANQAYASWIQRPLNEIVGHPILEVLGKDAFEALLPYFNRVLSGETVRYEQETNFQGIGPRWTSATYSPTLDANGVTNGWLAVVVDITERRMAEQVLRESEERFRFAAQAGRMFAYSWDAATDVIERSGESATILGIDEAAPLTGHQAISKVHPDDREGLLAAMAGLAPEKPFLQVTYRIVRPDESVIWVERHSRAYFDEHGKIKRIAGMIIDITERKRAEEALRQSEEKFLKAFRGSPVAITLSRVKDRRFIEVNDTFERLFGYRREEVIGSTASDLGLWVDPSQREELRNQLVSGQSHRDLELRFRTKNGRVLTCLVAAELIEVAKEPCVLSVASDITERKLTEDRLREYEKAVEGLEEMVVVVDRQYRYLIANRKFLNMRNMTKEQVEGRLANEVLNKRVFETVVKEKLDECFRGNVVRFEMKYTYPELGERDISVSYFPIEGATGVDRAACIVQDVTERKQMEEALKKSEEKFSKAFRESPLVVAITRMRDHRYLDVSASFEQWIGWRREEVIGRTPFDIGIWVDPAERSEFVKRLRAEGVVRNLEFRYRRKDGVEMVGLGSGELIEIGNEQCVISVIADITERKLAEERVRVSEERVRLAQWAARIGTFDLNIRTGVDNWTPETEALYGLPPGGFGGTLTAFENLIHPDDRERVIELTHEMMRTGQPAEVEFRVVWSDGSVHWIAARAQVFMDDSGGPSRMLGVNMDVTERKRAEEALSGITRKLVEAQEQERARIARELHDDINQRIALLAIELDQLQEKHKDLPSKVRGHVQKLRRITADMASRVYALSHELYSSIPDSLGLAKGMRSWCKEFGKQQKMEIDFKSRDLPRLPQEISLCLFRVLQEALHNAAKHSGVERIEVQIVENSGEIHLIVSDSGKGFDIDAARRRGGLGLMSMQERVRLVGGTIAIESKPMGGTAIRVRVPIESKQLS